MDPNEAGDLALLLMDNDGVSRDWDWVKGILHIGESNTGCRLSTPAPLEVELKGALKPASAAARELPLRSHPSAPTRKLVMGILTWIIVGLMAGVLASLVMGGTGYGLVGDIIIGIVGAFVGGWIISRLGASSPFGGLAGVIFVAFIGAVVLLFLLRLFRGASRRP